MSILPRSGAVRAMPLLAALFLGAGCAQDSTAPSPTSEPPSLAISGAGRTTCTLTPIAGSAYMDMTAEGGGWTALRGEWSATAKCDSHPLEFEVQIRQRARLRPLGGSQGGTNPAPLVGGTTQMQIIPIAMDDGIIPIAMDDGLRVRGEVRGNSSRDGGGISLSLQFQARGPGGAIRGTETLTVDPVQRKVTSFTPLLIDVILAP